MERGKREFLDVGYAGGGRGMMVLEEEDVIRMTETKGK
jgi:hypothetical protein